MMKIDSHNDFPEDLPPFYEQPFETSLFEQVEGVNFGFLEKEPMIEFAFDSQGLLTWDKAKLKIMQKKIEDLKRELEEKKKQEELEKEKQAQLEKDFSEYVKAGDAAMGKSDYEVAVSQYQAAINIKKDPEVQSKLDDAKKKLEDEKKNAELQKKFGEKMEAAKKEYDAGNYEQALALYKEATAIKPDEQLPKTRISEIEKLLADIKKNQETFNKLVAEGDKAVGSELYDDAISKYEQALNLIKDPGVQKKLDDAKAKKAEKEKSEADAKAKQEAFDKLVAEADKLFDTQKYEEAKSKYQEALTVIAGAEKPTKRIAEIDGILKKLEEENARKAKLEEDFKKLINEADALFEKKDWETAKTKYKAALDLKPSEEYPKNQIDRINKEMEAAKAEAAKNEQYKSLMAEAGTLMNQKKYEEARSKYNEALGVKPGEQEPKDKIAEIEKILADQKNAAEREKQYNDLMAEGNAFVSSKDYTAALERFEKALGVKSGDAEAQKKIDEVKKLLADQQKAVELEKQFQDLVAKGDQSFNAKSYQDAKTSYMRALDLKPDEGVKAKIKQCDEFIKKTEDAAAQKAKYDAAVKAADDLFAQKNYKSAMEKYQEALSIIEDDYPKGRISECKQKLEEIASAAEKEEKFQKLIAEGDAAYGNKEYQNALSKFKEAIAIKPDAGITKKINEITVLIEQQNQNAELMERYNKKIQEADAAFQEKEWEAARDLYTQAINIKDDQYPRDRIKKIEENMKAESEAEIEAQYQKIITKADGLRDQGQYDEAINYYQRAQKFKSDDPYPQEQIDAITKIRDDKARAEEEARKREEAYANFIKKADEAYNAKNWAVALENYKNAIDTKPDQQYPKDRVAEIQSKVGELESLKAKEDQYSGYIKLADAAFTAGDWRTSIKHYQEALEVFKDRPYPQDQIRKAEDQMKAEAEDEIEAEYQKILSVANKKFDEKNYERALELYLRAKTLKPEDPLPQKRIDEINKIIAELANKEKNQARYDQLIADADDFFRNEKWKEAKDKYTEAYNLINNKYPEQQIKACDLKMHDATDAELMVQYNKIIAKADEYFNNKVYDKARGLYQRALNLRPSDQYPKDRLAEIDKILNPNKYIANSNGMPNYGEANRGVTDIEAENLLIEAEKQRQWIANKHVQQQGEEYSDNIGSHGLQQENYSMDTKEDVDQMTMNIEENQWAADVKRTEFELDMVEIEEEVKDVYKEWGNSNEDAIQHQTQVIQQIELDMEGTESKSEVSRIEFIGDVEHIKLDVNEQTRQDAASQSNVNHDTKNSVSEMEEELVANDQNNDIPRKNTEVHLEDYEITLINSNNTKAWDAEDDIMETKEGTELLVDGITSDNISNDIPRIENVEKMDGLNEEYGEFNNGRADDQYDANIEQKKYTESLITEIGLENLNNDLPRQHMEDEVETRELEIQENMRDIADEQNNEVMTADESLEELEIGIEEDKSERDKNREGFEETVEEMELNIKDHNDNMARQTLDDNHSTVDHIDDMIDEKKLKDQEANLKNEDATDRTQEIMDDLLDENGDLSKKSEDDREEANDIIESLKDIDPHKITEQMKNQLGLEFPEGVTEEVYTINDENGLMTRLIVRRVVVRNGAGNFYEKVTTRFGTISYSMNGESITEYKWQDDTEASDLVRN